MGLLYVLEQLACVGTRQKTEKKPLGRIKGLSAASMTCEHFTHHMEFDLQIRCEDLLVFIDTCIGFATIARHREC